MDMKSLLLLQGVCGAVYMLIITTVGIRLLMLAKRNRGLPEFLLSITLLVGGTLGASLEASGAAMKQTVAPDVVGTLLLSGKTCGLVALSCQGLFIWRVFRPDARWAPALVGLYFSLAVAAFAGFWLHGTFATAEVPMSWFWLELVGRTTGSVWLTIEAIRYYRLMQKRTQLGIADPVVCNRFLLWALGGALGVSMMFTAVPPMLWPGSTNPLMALDVVAFSAFSIGFCIAYSLVFFPPKRYLGWIRERAAAAAP